MAQCDCHVIKSEFLRGARNGYGAWRVTVELGAYMKYQTWVEQHQSLTPWGAWRSGVESAAQVVEKYLASYHEGVFTQPQPGQHGKTVDACSAAALRAVLPSIIEDIRRLME